MKPWQDSLTTCLLLSLIFISSTGKADLPQSIFKEMMNNNLVPKIWQEYIFGNLCNFMVKSNEVKNFIHMLEKLQQKAHILKNASHLEVYAEAKGTVVKRASGMLTLFPRFDAFLSYKNSKRCPESCNFPLCIGYNWVFHLHHSLAANITIQELFFSSGLYFCKEGALKLKYLYTSLNNTKDEDQIEPCWQYTGHWSQDETYRERTEKYTWDRQSKFMFCGYYSSFLIFVEETFFILSLLIKRETYFAVQIEFSVMDNNVVTLTNVSWMAPFLEKYYVTLQNNNQLVPLHQYGMHTYVYSIDILSQMFIILVEKTKKISLYLHFSSQRRRVVTVYDGPGKLSKTLKKDQNGKFETTTYQCVGEAIVPFDSQLYIIYSAQKVTSTSIFVSNTTRFSSSEEKCQFLCAFHFNTKASFEINTTVLSMNYVGKTLLFLDINLIELSCSFGGLAIVGSSGSDAIEKAVICKNISSSAVFARNIVSSNSQTVIILYQYEKYSRVDATLQLSVTVCRSIDLDPCFLTSFVDLSDSVHYLDEILKIKNTGIEYLFDEVHQLQAPLVFSLKDNECFVLQAHTKVDTVRQLHQFHCHVCLIWLVYKERRQASEHFQYLIEGEIKPFPVSTHSFQAHLSSSVRNALSRNRLSDDICTFLSHEFLGVSEIEVLENMWNSHIVQTISGFDYFRNALVTDLYPLKTNKGFIWAKMSAINNRISILFGMFKNSFSRIGIIVWKKFEKDPITTMQIINLTSFSPSYHDHRLLPRNYILNISKQDKRRSEQECSVDIICKGINFFGLFHYNFETNVDERMLEKNYYLSLPFIVRTIQMIQTPASCELLLSIHWISEYTFGPMLHQHIKLLSCDDLHYVLGLPIRKREHVDTIYCDCFKFGFKFTLQFKYLVFGVTTETLFFPQNCPYLHGRKLSRMSWKEAAQLCKIHHSSLPNFYSRDEMYEVLSVIKMHPHINAIHSIYVGLFFYVSQQVCCDTFSLSKPESSFCGNCSGLFTAMCKSVTHLPSVVHMHIFQTGIW